MRVLVCGGRDYQDGEKLSSVLHDINRKKPISVIIEGGARGADYLAHVWAAMNGIYTIRYPADWNKYRQGAGVIRNQQMLTEGKPDLIVAFPGGIGTAHMVRIARKAGVEVYQP